MAAKRDSLFCALDRNGTLVRIEDVERGLACGCTCPACGEPLVAKKGSGKKIPHFAHHSDKNCEYAYETSLHLAAKSILENAKKLVIPPLYLQFPYSTKKSLLIHDAKEICIDSVELEKRIGEIVPDVVVYAAGSKLLVEIFVTHSVSDKLEKIKAAGISTIEIDLSDVDRDISMEDLEALLLEDSPQKQWVYSAQEAKKYKDFVFLADELPVADLRKTTWPNYSEQIVRDCPFSPRYLNKEWCAVLGEDCVCCLYYIQTVDCKEEKGADEKHIFCTGRERVVDCADFDKTAEERVEKNKDKGPESFAARLRKTEEALDRRKLWTPCPNCGRIMDEKTGSRGKYWRCSRGKPTCGFVIWYDKEEGEYRNSFERILYEDSYLRIRQPGPRGRGGCKDEF